MQRYAPLSLEINEECDNYSYYQIGNFHLMSLKIVASSVASIYIIASLAHLLSPSGAAADILVISW